MKNINQSPSLFGRLGRLSIKRKLVVIIMLVSSTAILLASGIFVTYQWYKFREGMVRDIVAQAKMLADNCTGSLSFDNSEDATELLNSLSAKPAIMQACVFRGDGTVLASYGSKELPGNMTIPAPGPEGHRFVKQRLEMVQAVKLNGRPIGSVYLSSDLSELSMFLQHSIIAVIVMILVISVVTYLISSRLQKVVSGPIFHLSDTARTVTQNQDYSIRAVKLYDDEMGRLTNSFNSMLVQIEERDTTLRQLRNLLSNIINSMPSVLVGVDSEGNVTQWNREAEKFTGIDADHAHGRTLESVFPQMASDMESIKLSIKEKMPQKKSKISTPKDGIPHYSDITVYPLIADGVEGAVIRIDDVTDQVRIEEMMIQSEKMLSVGGLAAGMAHEINNPLAGILQNVQVMRNRLAIGLPKNKMAAGECNFAMEDLACYLEKRGIHTMMESIIDSGRRAAQIVENMLSFSRKSDTRFAACNLPVLLDKTIELASNDYDLKKKYDFRRIEIVRQYDPETPEVWCESTKVQQVLLNLLKNGAEAMAQQNSQNPHFILRLLPDQHMVRIEVEDNGPGMEETVRKRIFEPFFTTKDVGLGTGLGLSVSYFIITENHGGTMSADSSPGKGTRFVIRLPLKGEKGEAKGANRES